jgi:hypothetical protein
MIGSKTIGTNVFKYPLTNLSTDNGGRLDLSNMEWDTYSITPTASTYDVAGINPSSPFILNPNNSQNIQLVLVPHISLNSLMVTVIDQSSKLPISGVTVQLTGPNGYDQTLITGEGYISQMDWSHGAIQNGLYTDQSAYSNINSGGVDTMTASSSGSIILHWNAGDDPYSTTATGTLESSTFDTGTTSNFYTLSWKPINQPILAGTASVKFQFATKPTSTSTFGLSDYLGPDGTNQTYFTVSGGMINALSSNNEFARYIAYLTTDTATVTPSVSNTAFSYTSACIPPGQVLFQGLSESASGYTLLVGKFGYSTTTISSMAVDNGWQQQTILLGP